MYFPFAAQGSQAGNALPHRDTEGKLFLWDPAWGPPPPIAPTTCLLDELGNFMPGAGWNDCLYNHNPPAPPPPSFPPFATPPASPGRGWLSHYGKPSAVGPLSPTPYGPTGQPIQPPVYQPPGGGPYLGLSPQPPPLLPVQPPIQPPVVQPPFNVNPNKPVLTPYDTTPLPIPVPKPNPIPAPTTPVLVPSPTGNGTLVPGFGDVAIEPTTTSTKWAAAGLFAGLTSPFWLTWLLAKKRRR